MPRTAIFDLCRSIGSRLLPIHSPKCVVPPGRLTARPGPTRPVLVASLMRTGTHLLIDLILNNFRLYRREPLYVQVDDYLDAGLPFEPLREAGPYILKTHVPQSSRGPERLRLVRELAAGAIVVIPRRPLDATREALLRFGPGGRQAAERANDDFEQLMAFYAPYEPAVFDFDEMIDPACTTTVLDRLSAALGQPLGPRVVAVPDARQVGRVLIDKALTRALGSAAPRINTTIAFRRHPRRPMAPAGANLAGARGVWLG